MKYLLCYFCMLLFFTYSLGQSQGVYDEEATLKKNPYYKKIIPAFSLKNLRGEDLPFEECMEKVVILHCWSLTCSACFKELVDLNDLVTDYRDSDVKILSLMPESASELLQRIEPSGKFYKLKKPYSNNDSINFEIIPDAKSTIMQLKNVDEPYGFPNTYILHNGKVEQLVYGYMTNFGGGDERKGANYKHLHELIEKARNQN